MNLKKILDNLKKRLITYHLSFTKEDGIWYIGFPSYPGPKGNLSMVAGADTLLDKVSDGHKFTTTVIKSSSKNEDLVNQGYIELERTSIGYGADYKVNTELYGGTLWLCPVTLLVLKEYPKYIYFTK